MLVGAFFALLSVVVLALDASGGTEAGGGVAVYLIAGIVVTIGGWFIQMVGDSRAKAQA